MASANVVNLAVKWIALNPQLTPEQTIALMKKGATPSAAGRLHLIDPKATVALLQQTSKEVVKWYMLSSLPFLSGAYDCQPRAEYAT